MREVEPLYDFAIQQELQEELLPVEHRLKLGFGFLPFVSPPFVALALAPLTSLSLPHFYVTIGIANLLLFAALLTTLQRATVNWPESWRISLLILALMWLPVTWALREGQVSILLALSLIAGYAALKGNHDMLGSSFGIVMVKPQYAIWSPALLLWRRWRAASAFVGISLTLCLYPGQQLESALTSYAKRTGWTGEDGSRICDVPRQLSH
jgi:hypothetical protein